MRKNKAAMFVALALTGVRLECLPGQYSDVYQDCSEDEIPNYSSYLEVSL